MSKIVIIGGMGRSGTSLIASLLQQAGVNLGSELAAPARMNPRGFFEDVEISQFHWNVLQARGLRGFESDFVFDPTADEIKKAHTLIERRQPLPMWGWKDPQTAMFLDFWHNILPEAHFLFLYRPPIDVLMSLVKYRGFHTINMAKLFEEWSVRAKRIENFCASHSRKTLLCHIYSVVDQIDLFAKLLRDKFSLSLPIDDSLLRSLYYPEELRRMPLMREVTSILHYIHPTSMRLYNQLEAIADLPLKASHIPAQTSRYAAELHALAKFVSTLSSEKLASPVCAHGLLLLLGAFLDQESAEKSLDLYAEHVSDLARSTQWLEEERRNWQRVAEERQKIIQEQATWIEELEKGKAWLEEQYRNWQRVAEERQKIIQEQATWIEELEKGKA